MAAETTVTVAFRVDSATQMGVGHVMRCLTLASELVRRGARVEFVCRELPGNAIARIEREGHRLTRLRASSDSSRSPWLQVPASHDAKETRAVLDRVRPDWLVVDHYGIDAGWERAQRSAVGRTLVIDDLADRRHDCDVLLDQNHFGRETEGRYDSLVAGECRKLLGPRYALVRREYMKLRSTLSGARHPGDMRRVLVYFGGADATDETSKALRALSAPSLAHLAVDVVVASNHPAPQAVATLVAARPSTTLFRELPSLADLLSHADLAVGGGGTTTWERLCLRVPSVVITLARNQEGPTAKLAEAGLVFAAGRAPLASIEQLTRIIGDALCAPRPARSIVDGHGLARVAAVLLPPSAGDLRVQHAKPMDCELLFDWRNEPGARAMSFDTEVIAWDTHMRWFDAKLADPDTEIFVAEVDGLPVGQARLDYRDGEAVLSYSVDPVVRGLGFGTALVDAVIGSARRLPPAGFRARVKTQNVASQRIFERLRWRKIADADALVYGLSEADAALAREDARARPRARGGEQL